jgi:hypothetical protein
MENFWRDAGSLWSTGKKAANEAANSIGIDSRRITEAIAAGQGETMAKDFDTLSKAASRFPPSADEIEGALDRLNLSMTGDQVKAKSSDFAVLSGKVTETSEKFGTAEYKAGQFNAQLDKSPTGVAAQRISEFNTAMGIYNDKTQTADSRTRALKTALDLLNGKQPDLEEAQLKVNEAMRAAEGTLSNVNGQMVMTGGVFRDTAGNLLNFNGVIDATTGKIDTASSAGAGLYKGLRDTTDGVLATTTAMRDAGRPVEEISAYLATSRAQFVAMGEAAGLNGELVGKAYDHMIGANPKDLLTTITAQGVEEAKGKVLSFKGTVDEIDGRKAVVALMGDNVPLGIKLEESLSSLSDFDAVVATATAGLDPTQANAVRIKLEEDLLILAGRHPTVLADMDPALLNRKKWEAEAALNELGRMKPSPTVNAEISAAQQKLQTILNLIDNIKPKNVSITTTWKEIGSPPSAPGLRMPATIDGGYNGYLKDGAGRFPGGFRPQQVQAFANGGVVHEKPGNAKIYAPVSKFRVFSEAVTGGEAYIPLAASKRERSTAILAQVASQFGMKLTNAQSFADGGVVTQDRTGGGVSVSIGNYTTQASDTPDDVARALMRRVKTAGVYTPLEGF